MIATAHVLVPGEVVGELLGGRNKAGVDGLVEPVQRGRKNSIETVNSGDDFVGGVVSVNRRSEFLVLSNYE